MSVAREGGCSCGAVRYRLTSEPLFVNCCHCLNCQRQTGSAFVINVLIETDRVERLGAEPQPVDVPRERREQAADPPLSEVPGRGVQRVHTPRSAVRTGGTLDAVEGVARRPHLHEVEAELGRASRVGAGIRHLLRLEEAIWPASSLERLAAIMAPADSGA